MITRMTCVTVRSPIGPSGDVASADDPPPVGRGLWLARVTPTRPLRDTHETHRLLAAWVPPAAGRTLWAALTPTLLLVQTSIPPPPRPQWMAQHLFSDYGPALGALRVGDRVRLDLVANPTRVTRENLGAGRWGPPKIRALPADQRAAWLRRRLAAALDVESLWEWDLGPAHGRRRGHTLTHVRHQFRGDAVVRDPAGLRELVRRGVGRGKAFGCGLLLIRPLGGGGVVG